MGAKQHIRRRKIASEDDASRLTREVLGAKFPSTEAYRTEYDTIRVRIIDDRFTGMNRIKREKMVLPLIHKLPEEIQSQIIVLLLLAPGEEDGSILNFEFERSKRKMGSKQRR